mmetsp:Transcript_77714/g.202304  ORF Transcript_77714/g.202304 Transcript_77714/m.202304 type:complete len:242 (+) Transcript_77714:902-1627(+)
MRRRRRPGRSPTGCATATPRILVSRPSGVWVDAQCPQLLSEGVGGGPVLATFRLDPTVKLRLQHRAVLRPLPRASSSSSSPRGRCQRGQPGGRGRHRHVRQVGFGLEGRPAHLLSARGLLHHHRLHGRVPVRRSGGVGVDAHAPQLAAEGVRGGEVLLSLGDDPLVQLRVHDPIQVFARPRLVRRTHSVRIDAVRSQILTQSIRGGEVLVPLRLDPLIQFILSAGVVAHGGTRLRGTRLRP